jgi:hypothetical protein
MRRFVVLVSVLVAALAAPASATVLAEEEAAAGPVFDGAGVTWATEVARGLVVRTWQDGVVRDRVRQVAPKNLKVSRGVFSTPSALAASPSWLAFAGATLTDGDCDGDACSTEVTSVLWSGPAAGPLTPRRRPVSAVAADGPTLAWAEATHGRRSTGDRHHVILREEAGTRRLAAGRGPGRIRRVALAGPYVAWTFTGNEGSGLVVAEHASGRRVLALAGEFSDLALDADGRVAAIRRGAVATASVADRRLRTIVRRDADFPVALGGGRVAYRTSVGEDRLGIAVVPFTGGAPRPVVSFPEAQSQITRFAFDGRRLAWSETIDPFGAAPAGRVQMVDVP